MTSEKAQNPDQTRANEAEKKRKRESEYLTHKYK